MDATNKMMVSFICFILLFQYQSFALSVNNKEKPNIVIVLCDDLGWSDLGTYGSEIKTPALDSLAKEGILMTHFYTCARCSPSRASLMTGMYPQKVGMGYLDKDFGVDFKGYRGFLSPQYQTIAEIFKAKGYSTYMAGKWHLGSGQGQGPQERGFEKFCGLLSGSSSYKQIDQGRFYVNAKGEKITGQVPYEGFYMTEDITRQALGYLKEASGRQKPFLLYVAYTAPHTPLEAKESTISRYLPVYEKLSPRLCQQRRWEEQKKRGLVGVSSPKTSALPASVGKGEILKQAIYAAQVEDMDEGIGQLMRALKKEGLEKNTLVIFMSDNGATKETPQGREEAPYSLEPYKKKLKSSGYGKDWATVSNTPFRGYKTQTFEGGIAAPCLVWMPERLKKSAQLSRPVHIMDVLPTCLELAQIEAPAPLQGESFLSLCRKESQGKDQDRALPLSKRLLFWEHDKNRAVLSSQYKMVKPAGEKNWLLYAQSDRLEQKNIAGEHPEVVKKLSEEYERWAEQNHVRFDYKVVY